MANCRPLKSPYQQFLVDNHQIEIAIFFCVKSNIGGERERVKIINSLRFPKWMLKYLGGGGVGGVLNEFLLHVYFF